MLLEPTFTQAGFQCHLSVSNPEDNEDFSKFWKNTQKCERQRTLKSLTDYFESCIEMKNKEINNVRGRTFQKLGSKTKVSADAKRELDNSKGPGRTYEGLGTLPGQYACWTVIL
jgi:hypothetical protein